MIELSIVVPVYNEEDLIIKTLTKLNETVQSIGLSEIIVVSDGSTDHTNSILEGNPNLYTRLICLKENKGKGAAVKAGLEVSTGTFVLIQDADAEYDPVEIPRLWLLTKNLELDLLATTRFSGSEITRVHYFWHKIGNRFITLLFNLRNNTTFTDIYSGYLIFRRKLVIVEKLKYDSWGQQAEILKVIVNKSNRIYETPISYFGRTYSEGKKIRASSTLNVIKAILFTK
jgi:glycosyltransferase involved in cell wall biosynthesis